MVRPFAFLVLTAALAAGPASAQGGFLGVNLEPAPQGSTGARIASIVERSAASIMGLQAGDLVTAVDGVAVADPGALAQLISSHLPGDVVELTVLRDGASSQKLGVLARRPGMPRVAAPGGPDRSALPGMQLDLQPRIVMPDFWQDLPDFKIQMDQFRPELAEELRSELDRMLQDRQLMLEDLQRQLEGLDWNFGHPGADGFRSRNDWFGTDEDLGDVFLRPGEPLKADAQTKVRLRYPAGTSLEEQERLRAAAIEKYGPEVQVEFAGEGTAVIIERRVHRGSADSVPQTPPTPATPPGTTREF